jgi:hypothetical protein
MKSVNETHQVTVSDYSIETLRSMSLKKLARVTSIPRTTLHYRINTMQLSVEDAINHKKHQWSK